MTRIASTWVQMFTAHQQDQIFSHLWGTELPFTRTFLHPHILQPFSLDNSPHPRLLAVGPRAGRVFQHCVAQVAGILKESWPAVCNKILHKNRLRYGYLAWRLSQPRHVCLLLECLHLYPGSSPNPSFMLIQILRCSRCGFKHLGPYTHPRDPIWVLGSQLWPCPTPAIGEWITR